MVRRLKKKIEYRIKELEIHTNKSGWLVELLKANEIKSPIKQIHVASIKPGRLRGNHYHSKRIEWMLIITGRVELCLQDVNTKEKICFKLSEKEPKVITVFPFISHKIKNIGKKTAYLISAQNDIYNRRNPDAFPFEIKS